MGKLLAKGGIIFLLLLKMSKLAKVAKLAALAKPLLVAGSVTLSVFSYSFFMGVSLAIGFVAMIMIHELGHVAAIKQKGFKASVPVFIPFLGAAIFMPKMEKRGDEAYVAFGGPLIGTAGAVVVLIMALAWPGGSAFLAALAFIAILINLFNLIPISPLDGGRITQAVGPAFKYVGGLMLLGLTVWLQSPSLLVIWLIVLADLRINPKAKLVSGLIIEAVLIAMIALGIGQDIPFWAAVVNIGLVSLLNLVLLIPVLSGAEFEDADERPALAGKQRLKWLAGYALLAAALVGLMVYSTATLSTFVIG